MFINKGPGMWPQRVPSADKPHTKVHKSEFMAAPVMTELTSRPYQLFSSNDKCPSKVTDRGLKNSGISSLRKTRKPKVFKHGMKYRYTPGRWRPPVGAQQTNCAGHRPCIPAGPQVAKCLDFSAPMTIGQWQQTLGCLTRRLTSTTCLQKDELTSCEGKVVIHGLSALNKENHCQSEVRSSRQEDAVSQVSEQLSRLGHL